MRKRERRRVRWTAALGVVVLAVLGFAGYKFAAGIGTSQPTAAVTSRHPAQGGRSAAAPSIAPSVQAGPAQPSRTATPDGDDPQGAPLALAGHPARAWSSDWYTTSDFGHLQSGAGLLLDMGRAVAVSAGRPTLGGRPGADLQLRAGSRPVLAGLRPVATSAGAGGTAQLSLTSPVHARYLLIWFTKLPPDPAGTYQVSVYRIRVLGLR